MFMEGEDVPRDFLVVAINCLDIALLGENTTEEQVRNVCERAKNPGEGLRAAAGVAVLPAMVEVAAEALKDSPVRTVVAAGGFPEGTLSITRRQPEVKRAIRLGADEIDTVFNWRAFLSGNEAQAWEEIAATAKWMRDKKLKVILETAALETPEKIKEATDLVISAGADFVKTSTGAVGGATEGTARPMVEAVAEHHARTGKMVGVKFSGGITDGVEAMDFMSMVIGVLGFAFLSPHTFRLGSSSLFENILREFGQEPR